MAYAIVLENSGGELGRWPVEKEEDLAAKMVEVVAELETLHEGDVFRVVEA
jgi:hypothetical protein